MRLSYIIILVIIIFITWIIYKYFSSPVEIIELTKNNKSKFNRKLQDFEKKLSHWYPLGDDFFNITHGGNYYGFFERMGKMYMKLCIYNKKVVGTACGILRNIKSESVWYLCDLKIDPEFRGKHIPFKMMLRSLDKLCISNKVYGISMNNDKENRVMRLAKNIPIFNFKNGGKLMIYSLDYEKFMSVMPIISEHRGNISFLSLTGIKDLILKSTNKPLPILHVQWGKDNQTELINPIEGYTYMFCCLEGDKMYNELTDNNIITDISATIIHYNMDNCDWKFILTSEI